MFAYTAYSSTSNEIIVFPLWCHILLALLTFVYKFTCIFSLSLFHNLTNYHTSWKNYFKDYFHSHCSHFHWGLLKRICGHILGIFIHTALIFMQLRRNNTSMAALCSSLVSLAHIIDNLRLNHPNPPISFDKKQLLLLTEMVTFLEGYISLVSTGSGNQFETSFRYMQHSVFFRSSNSRAELRRSGRASSYLLLLNWLSNTLDTL